MKVGVREDEEVSMNTCVCERAQVYGHGYGQVGVYVDAQEGVRMMAEECVAFAVGADRCHH